MKETGDEVMEEYSAPEGGLVHVSAHGHEKIQKKLRAGLIPYFAARNFRSVGGATWATSCQVQILSLVVR